MAIKYGDATPLAGKYYDLDISQIQLNVETYKFIDAVTYTKQINWERTSYDSGDWVQTITLTNANATDISITGTLISDTYNTGDDEQRCDVILYLNDSPIAFVCSMDGFDTISVNYKVASADGITIKLVISPHSRDRGRGSFKGTVVYTV